MPPSAALVIWFVCLLALLRFDPASQRRKSWTLWVPVTWFFIAATRLPSQWLNPYGKMLISAQTQDQGNPTDRLVYVALIVLAIGILAARRFPWGPFFQRNSVLAVFLLFCLVSVTWSDFPLVAFKRWFRDLGDYAVLLVVLSDPEPLQALRTVLRRLCFLVIPLSVVLLKYYPALAIHYSFWTGAPEYVGAATSKNTLGGICLIGGLALCWDTILRWPERKKRQIKLSLLVNALVAAMLLWLLHLSNSATSHVCLALGCAVMLAARTKWARRHSRLFKVLMPASFFLYLVMEFVFDMNGQLVAALGRNATLTGRTEIWATLLSMHTNPLVGTGYESFWMGPRLLWIWQQRGQINEAHNGYLEVYLNLGLVGLALVILLLMAAYRNICRGLDQRSGIAVLGAAAWTLMLFYSVTEAAFVNGLIWMTFLLGSMAVPLSHKAKVRAPAFVPAAKTAWSPLEVVAKLNAATSFAGQSQAKVPLSDRVPATPTRNRWHL